MPQKASPNMNRVDSLGNFPDLCPPFECEEGIVKHRIGVWTGCLFLLLAMAMSAQTRKVVESHGLNIGYRTFGSGAPVLILGGGPGDVSDRYLDLCHLLAPHCRCILVDQRGTGPSKPAVLDSSTVSIALTLDDFEAIRKREGFSQWNVLGFSYGGYLASLYTQRFPQAVSGLILLGSMGLNTAAFPHFMDNIASRLQATDLERFEFWSDSARVAENPHHALVKRIQARMPGYFYDRKKSLLVSETMKDSDFDFEMGQWIWRDVEKRDLDLSKMKQTFHGPVLILHGRQDPLGESVARDLAEYYPKSRMQFIERAGHYSWIEQPEKVAGAVKAFLSEKGGR